MHIAPATPFAPIASIYQFEVLLAPKGGGAGFKNIKTTAAGNNVTSNTETVKSSVFSIFSAEQTKDLKMGRTSSQFNIEVSGAIGIGLILDFGIKIPIWKSDH